MNINELAQELHANAVAHGWWDEEPDDATHLALIHSEWSEALQEARSGRPLVYGVIAEGDPPMPRMTEDVDALRERRAKPDGVAVELIDGVIRILDWFAHDGIVITANPGEGKTEDFESLANLGPEAGILIPPDVPTLVTMLHSLTSQAWENDDRFALVTAASMALNWVRMRGIDPLAVLLAKHEYNKTRKYKHGKRF